MSHLQFYNLNSFIFTDACIYEYDLIFEIANMAESTKYSDEIVCSPILMGLFLTHSRLVTCSWQFISVMFLMYLSDNCRIYEILKWYE